MKKLPSTNVMEVFSIAASSDFEGQIAYLDRACKGNPAFLAEVISLLAAHSKMGKFLDEPNVESNPPVDSLLDPTLIDSIDEEPACVGPYQIIERLGQGGFGVVYRAQQDHPIHREVALKVIKPGMDSRQIIARFETERQALALMDHPHIARIFDAGRTADARPYFAMELVTGEAVTKHCDTRRLGVTERLALFVAVCQAVQHAHTKGIIHRDLKPSNILVADVDGTAVPKIIDFGIAKAMSNDPAQQSGLTELRQFLGTPQYMSPEQAGAGTGGIDARSDIYSLGILLYELLTGTTPFDAQVPLAGSQEQVHRAIREHEPRRPSVKLSTMGPLLEYAAARRGLDAQKLHRVLAGELDWIVMKAIEKDPARRYETVAALADDVRRYLANEPLAAGPPGNWYRAKKFIRKHRGPLLAAAAIVLVLCAGLAGTASGLVRARRDRDRAESALIESRTVSNFLDTMLRAGTIRTRDGKPLLVRDLLDFATTTLAGNRLKNSPFVEASIRTTVGNAYDSLSMYPQSQVQLRAALELRRGALGNKNPDTVRSISALSTTLLHANDIKSAEPLGREAVSILETLYGQDSPELISPLTDLAAILAAKPDRAGAEAAQRRAVALARKIEPKNDAASLAITNLAVSLLDRGELDEAEPLFREALALDRKLHGEKFFLVPRNLCNLGVIRQKRGDFKAADDYLQEALDIQRKMFPSDHPDTGFTLKLLGRLKGQERDLPAAEKYSRQALEINRNVYGPTHPTVVAIMFELSVTLDRLGRYPESRALEKQANQIRLSLEKEMVENHPDSAIHQGNLGAYQVFMGQFQEAQQHLALAATLPSVDMYHLILKASLDQYLNDEPASTESYHRLLRESDRLTSPAATQAALACLLHQPNNAEMRQIERMVPRETPLANRTPYETVCIGLADLRGGHPAEAIKSLREWRKEFGPLRVVGGIYLAIAILQNGNEPDARANLSDALIAFNSLARLADGYIGPIGAEWLECHVAFREAQEKFAQPVHASH